MSRAGRCRFALVATFGAFGALAGFAARAAADAPASALRWDRAAGADDCIDERALVAGVERRLGATLAERTARRVTGQIDRLDDRFRVRLVVRDETGEIVGERELVEPGNDCHRIDDKLALVIALLVDDDAATPRRAIAAPPRPPIATMAVSPAQDSAMPISPAIDRDDPLATPARASAEWTAQLGVVATAAAGVLPSLGLGARGSLAITPPMLPRIEASVGIWMPDRITVSSGTIRFTLADATLAACPRIVTRARFTARACAGAGVARMTATGSDFDMNERALEWIAHGLAAGVVDAPLNGRLRGTIEVGGWAPLVRPRFTYFDGTATREAYQLPAVAVVLGFGVAMAL